MAPSRNSSKSKGWGQIITVITTPLGFYVLALLIVETTLTIVLTSSKLTDVHVWDGFKWMIGVLGAVVAVVTALTVWNPKHLLYGKDEHREPLLEPSALKDQIEDLIAKNVKAECLKNDSK